MATFLTYLLGLLVVGGVLFLLASFAFGRGEELAPMPPDGTPVELPDGRFGSDAVRALRLSVVLRGYRMAEVDWVLDVLASQLDARDQEIARLRADAGQPAGVAAEPASLPAEPASTAGEPASTVGEPASTVGEPVDPGAEPVDPGAEPILLGDAAATHGRGAVEPPGGSEQPPDSGPTADREEVPAPAVRGYADSPMDRAVRAARAGVSGSAHPPAAEAAADDEDG